MGLIKRRPEVKLFAPNRIRVGVPFRVRVVLECKQPVPVDAIELDLRGAGRWASYGGQHHYGDGYNFARYVAKLLEGPVELPRGSHEYLADVVIRPGMPGTYRGRAIGISWIARVHVDIPWWPDARARFLLHVEGTPSPPSLLSRQVFATAADGPVGRKPYAEVSLGSTVVEPGRPIAGKVALANTDSVDYKALHFSLVAHERVTVGWFEQTETHPVAAWTLRVDNPGENQPLDFALAAPAWIPSPFALGPARVDWGLELRVDAGWTSDVKMWIPLQIGEAQLGEAREQAVPLAVGSDRLAAIWAAVARQTGFNFVGDELSREIGICRLSVRREPQSRGRVRVIGEAEFRDLDLGLTARKGKLACRDAAQSKLIAEATASTCPVDHADDRRIRCEMNGAGTRPDELLEFVQHFDALVRAFEEVRIDLPPPADAADLLPAFRIAARQLGGDLDVASMDVRGMRDEIAFTLESRWQGDELARTVLTVRPTLPIDGRYHQALEEEGELPDDLARLAEGSRGVVIDASCIEIVFPPRPDDLQDLTNRLEALIAVGQRLSGRAFGYR